MARWGVREAMGRYMYEIAKKQKFKRQGKYGGSISCVTLEDAHVRPKGKVTSLWANEASLVGRVIMCGDPESIEGDICEIYAQGRSGEDELCLWASSWSSG